ncbi:MAG: DUF4293 domain-containing protein [Prevotellaceae bacterium]|jgi:hypothetical protein|nr:DUF4293 domain-containing protein [Prevotellaceae bacterium]
MIQRIQTLFLFLAAAISCSGIFFDWAKIDSAAQQLVSQSNAWVATIFAVAVPVLTLVAIFLFKNRKLQLIFCNAAIVATVCFYASLGFYIYRAMTQSATSIGNVFVAVPAFFPLVSLIFIVLAKKFIKKDEKKVHAWERIR